MKKIITVLLLIISSYGQSQQDINIATGTFEGEPYLAINPTNPKNIVIAWMHITIANRPIRTRSSFDGGITWQSPVDLPIVNTKTADPTMAFDTSGNLFLCIIDHLGTSSSTNIGGIYSYKSTDGGLTWGSQVKVIDIAADSLHQPIDRPWLVCDRSNSPNSGNLYLTTKTVKGGPAPYHPYFMKSTDGGISWSNWKYIDTTGWLSGISSTFAAPTVSANGTFVGIYPSYVTSQSPLPRYMMAYSNNGGNSFQYKNSIVNLPGASNDSAKRGWQFIADPDDNNHLAFFFISGSSGDLDILMTETYDFGNTWSSAQRVNDDPSGNGILQDLVWASFDEDSDLVVCWRDRRNDGNPGYARSSQIYGAVRWKDSSNFSPNFIISDTLTSYNNILAEAGNDFLCQQLHQDTLYVTWGDVRTGFLNIWFEKIALASGNSTGLKNLTHSEIPIIQVYPNPTSNFVTLNVNNEEIQKVNVYSISGKLMRTFSTGNFSIEDLPKGKYFIVTQTKERRYTNKLVKI